MGSMRLTLVLLAVLVGLSQANATCSSTVTVTKITTITEQDGFLHDFGAETMSGSTCSTCGTLGTVWTSVTSSAVYSTANSALEEPLKSSVQTLQIPEEVETSGVSTSGCNVPVIVTVTVIQTVVATDSLSPDETASLSHDDLRIRHMPKFGKHSKSAKDSKPVPSDEPTKSAHAKPASDSSATASGAGKEHESNGDSSATASGTGSAKAPACSKISHEQMKELENADQGSDGLPPCEGKGKDTKRAAKSCKVKRGGKKTVCASSTSTGTAMSCASIRTSMVAGPTGEATGKATKVVTAHHKPSKTAWKKGKKTG